MPAEAYFKFKQWMTSCETQLNWNFFAKMPAFNTSFSAELNLKDAAAKALGTFVLRVGANKQLPSPNAVIKFAKLLVSLFSSGAQAFMGAEPAPSISRAP